MDRVFKCDIEMYSSLSKYFLITMLIIATITCIQTSSGLNQTEESPVFYFYIYGSYGCPHCRSMKDFLVENYGEQHVYFCSIDSEGENRTRFIELVEKGFINAIPTVFIIYNYTVSAVIIGEYKDRGFLNSFLKTNYDNKVPVYTLTANGVILYRYMVIKTSHQSFILKYLYWDKYLGNLDRENVYVDFELKPPEISFTNILLATLPALIIYGLLDSINPCVLIMYFTLVASAVSRRESIKPAVLFIAIIYTGYLLYALGLLFLATLIPGKILIGLAFIMGIYTIIRAGREKTPSFKCKWCEKISFINRFMGNKYVFVTILGLLSVIVLLPCTSGPLSGYIGLLRNYVDTLDTETLLTTIPIFLLYNILFILPLLVILILVYYMGKEKRLAQWFKENGAAVEFLIGVVLAMFSLILLLS